MPKPSLEFNLPDSVWTASTVLDGVWERKLAEDSTAGEYTGLIRYEPAVDTSPLGIRAHPYWEEVYVLEGDLTDLSLGTTFTTGMYACRPPYMPHGPWRTDSGVLMLEFRYPGK
jgi:hypothetical protein